MSESNIVFMIQAFDRLTQAIQRTHFAFLDWSYEEIGSEGSAGDLPRSWEVEREAFLRHLDAG